MRTRSQARHAWSGALVLPWVLVLASGWPAPALAATDGQASASPPAAPSHRAPQQRRGASLDDRVRILSKTLDLDARQQVELRKVLVAQREETLEAWADESVPPAERIKATERISQRTGDRIRALLNEEQRKRYNPPRLQRDAEPGSSRPTVESWMNRPLGEEGSP